MTAPRLGVATAESVRKATALWAEEVEQPGTAPATDQGRWRPRTLLLRRRGPGRATDAGREKSAERTGASSAAEGRTPWPKPEDDAREIPTKLTPCPVAAFPSPDPAIVARVPWLGRAAVYLSCRGPTRFPAAYEPMLRGRRNKNTDGPICQGTGLFCTMTALMRELIIASIMPFNAGRKRVRLVHH